MSLITLSDIKAVKHVSSHLGRKADQAIQDAEILDIKPLLGEKLYFDMRANEDATNYALLLDGGEYTYDDFTYDFVGLKRVHVEFAYARLIFFGSETASPHGVVEKINQDSRHISRDRKKELWTASRQTAVEFWEEVRRFLIRKEEDFPHWDICKTNPGKVSGFKMTHIRG